MIVTLTLKKQKLFQSPSVNNQAFQKFINLCRNEYGEDFLVRKRNNDTCEFSFRVSQSRDDLKEYLEKRILPQIFSGNWKKDSYIIDVSEDVSAPSSRPTVEVPVYKPPVTATPKPAPEPVKKKEEAPTSSPSAEVDAVRAFLDKQQSSGNAPTTEAPKTPEPVKKTDKDTSSGSSSEVDAVRDFLSRQTQGSSAEASRTPEPKKTAESPKPAEPEPKKSDSAWTDDRTPAPDMNALRAFLAKQGQGGDAPTSDSPKSTEPPKPVESPKPAEPEPKKSDSTWTDDRTPAPDMDALRAFLAKQGQGGDAPTSDSPKSTEPPKPVESPKSAEPEPKKSDSTWADDRTPRPDMDALRAFLSRQNRDSDGTVEITDEPDRDSPVHDGEVEVRPGASTAPTWSGSGDVVDVEAEDVPDESEETPSVDVTGLLGALTDHLAAQNSGSDDDQSDDTPKKPTALVMLADDSESVDDDASDGQDDVYTETGDETTDTSSDTEETPSLVPAQAEYPEPMRTEVPQEPESEVLAQIYDLVGAHAFKNMCGAVHSRANFIRVNNTKKVFLSDAYLFAINRGEGFSRALELFSALMVDEGIIEQRDINELTPPAPTDRELEDRMQRFLRNVENVMEASRTLSLDISEWIGRTGSGIFKKLLLHVFQRVGNTLVIFRIPCVSQNLIDQTKRDLDDIMITKAVIFEPFTQEELRSFATRMLNDYGFTVNESVWPYYDRKVMDEKRDGYFYGLHTIRKITNAMIRRAEEYSISTGHSTTVIVSDMVTDWIPKQEEGLDAMAELEALVGMDSVKEQILEIVNQIRLSREAGGKQPCMHMAFVGSAGTGKTTVARILGKLLKEMGILRIGNFYEHTGRDLCGRFVGETAIKTTAICQEAYGSVLFIDEAYSLFRGDFSTNDYGREAIDTLIAEMENHRDDMLVIFAGYTQDMDILMTANAGMESRVPYRITFPNYEPETLSQIFLHMVGESFAYDTSLEKASHDYFTALSPEQIQASDFGNARFVRNLYERVWGKAAMRCTDTRLEDLCITAQDFHAAVDSMESTTKKKKTKKPIGFG